MKKKVTRDESTAVQVLPKQEVAASARVVADSILAQVANDMNIAELGKFYALRAGIGLLAVKGMVPHGGWAELVAARFPNRTERTIRRYQQDADAFLKERGLKVGEAWRKISEIDETLLRRAAARLLLGEEAGEGIPLKQIPPVVRWMGEYLTEWEEEKPKVKPPKPITAEEKMETQRQRALQISSEVDEWQRQRNWTLVQDSNVLEGVASSLKAAADSLRAEIRQRAQNGKRG